MVNDIAHAQKLLRHHGFDRWLLSDLRNRDPFIPRLLGSDRAFATRRWFYVIPRQGIPTKIVSAVEPHLLHDLGGREIRYQTWKELHTALRSTLGSKGARVALQYAPRGEIPYLSTLDAGTVDLIRSLGYRIESAAPLVHAFVSALSPHAYRTHLRAARLVDGIRRSAFTFISKALRARRKVTEYDVQQFIMRSFKAQGLHCDHPPMVGVNEHPADPHFEVSRVHPARIKRGDTILIDLWARVNHPAAIYYDSTWVGVIGSDIPAEYARIFDVVRRARDAAVHFIQERTKARRSCRGCDVDDVARTTISRAGYGDAFIHRTGHSITTSTHGEGVNIDNFETRDTRELLPGALFSIEPGIYLPGRMAVRSEINVFIHDGPHAEVTGEIQHELVMV